MTTAVVLYTRDLRVHDHPPLAAACRRADTVVPLFVLHDRILTSRYASPTRTAHLVEALHDLRANLRARDGDLVVRHGHLSEIVRSICVEVAADELHVSADVSGFARRREDVIRRVADDLGVTLHVHPGVTLVSPGDLAPAGGDHFKVFTPYWRRWVEHAHRDPEPAPPRVPTPGRDHPAHLDRPAHPAHRGDPEPAPPRVPTPGRDHPAHLDRPAHPDHLDPGDIPAASDLVAGDPAPERRFTGGETHARARLDAWFDGPIEDYEDARNQMAVDGTSQLSAYLHLGEVSPAQIAARVDRRRRGHEPFLQELCWRDFNHQLVAARPDMVTDDYRPQGDDWRTADDEAAAVEAWKDGRTGYPVVDAGMRQLRREGYMHNRARMIVASFLTKHLRIDWRVGAWHFMDHLEDGDIANNFGQWQWTAGTGTDSRPNRMFNPVTQGERYDPSGAYVRRYVPELADLHGKAIHAPWQHDGSLFAPDYPPPLVDHAEARARFLAERGR